MSRQCNRYRIKATGYTEVWHVLDDPPKSKDWSKMLVDYGYAYMARVLDKEIIGGNVDILDFVEDVDTERQMAPWTFYWDSNHVVFHCTDERDLLFILMKY